MGRHFISYSRGDGKQFAFRLYDALGAMPDVQLWMDDKEMPLVSQYGERIPEGIAECDSFLFVWTRGSARSEDCRSELFFAKEYLKPKIVLEVHRRPWNLDGRRGEMDMYEIAGWPTVDFAGEFDSGLAKLREQFDYLASREGRLFLLGKRRDRVLRALEAAANAAERELAWDKLAEIDEQVAELSEREAPAPGRGPGAGGDNGPQERPSRLRDAWSAPMGVPDLAARPTVLLPNPLPEVPEDPWQFQDRTVQTQRLHQCLADDFAHPVVVSGEAGLGKTAMVSRLLRDLAYSQTPPFDSIVYLSAEGVRPVRVSTVLEDLCAVFLDASRCGSLLSRSQLNSEQKLEELLRQRPEGTRVLLVVDSVEQLLDGDRFRDAELRQLLERLLSPYRTKGLKLLLVSRRVPEGLLKDSEPFIRRIPLDEGLPVEDARAVLRRLDAKRPHRLPDGPEALLDEACRRAGGHPRALEALYGLLRYDLSLTLEDVVQRMRRRAPNEVVNFLIVERFNRLDWAEQRIVEALAVYQQPVDPDAVNYLLEPYVPDSRSEYTLARLAEQGFVRQDGSQYYLPLPDRELVLRRVEHGDPVDRDRTRPPFTMLALLHRAADYFVHADGEEATDVGDLSRQLCEIDLRIRGQEFAVAFDLIQRLDETYLDRWGRSGELARHRVALIGKLGNQADELVNLAGLADSQQQRGLPDEAIAHYRRAIDIAWQLGDAIDLTVVADLRISLGSALYWDGQLDEALRSYEQALAMAEEHLRRDSQAAALSGLSVCHAEIGQYTRALERANQGLEIACAEGQHELEAEILLNVGVWHGQLGQTHRAIERLGQAMDLAGRQGRRVMEAKTLSATAEVLIDQGRLAEAVRLANEAIAIGERLENPDVVPSALATRALAHLCAGTLDLAWESARQASNLRRAGHALTAPLLSGIIALRRQGDRPMAEDFFLDAHSEAVSSHGEKGKRVEYLDVEGIACCGLARAAGDGEERLNQAVRAFRTARAITAASGIVDRTVRLLDELENPWSSGGRLSEARQAATRRRSLRRCSSLDQASGPGRSSRTARRR
jgi:tetratricopeptide (TPR) repeat protein